MKYFLKRVEKHASRFMVGEASFPVFREGAFPAESLGKFAGKRRDRRGTDAGKGGALWRRKTKRG